MDKETKKKLIEAITFIENTAQNEQVYDTVISNEWSFLEADARELREVIEQLETPEEYQERSKNNEH